MIVQIDNTNNDESKEDTMVELFNSGDSLDIGIKYEWDNSETDYKNAQWVTLKGTELREFFNTVKAIEKTMIESGEIV